jgi:hypothetical protein
MPISRMQQPRQMYQEGGIMPRLNQLGSGVSSAEQLLQGINQRLQSAESSLGSGGGGTLANLASSTPSVQTPDPFFGKGELQLAGGGTQQPLGYASYEDMMKNRIQSDVPNFFTDLQGVQKTPDGGLYNASDFQSSLGGLMTSGTAGGMQSPLQTALGRQNYGLGSLVKSVTKGVKSAVSGVKDFAKSDLGKAALLAAGGYYLGGGSLLGMQRAGMSGFSLGNLPGASAVSNFFTAGDAVNKAKKAASFGDTMKVFAGGSLLGGLLNQAEQEGDPEGITRNVGALRTKLTDAYRNQKTFADEADEESAIAAQVERDLSEYSQDMARTGAMYGGRMGYAIGSPEKNAVKAAGIEGLLLNQNPAGVTELDLRESGGFIPPVGVKEKADDIPAMLSNNEFVFTADAVRNMGDGNVNKGAQRMYDFMKYLENGGRV